MCDNFIIEETNLQFIRNIKNFSPTSNSMKEKQCVICEQVITNHFKAVCLDCANNFKDRYLK